MLNESKYAEDPDIRTISLLCSRSKKLKIGNFGRQLKATKNCRANLGVRITLELRSTMAPVRVQWTSTSAN